MGVHGQAAIAPVRPLFPRPVPVQLDSIAVGIAQINRFADAMIGRAFQAYAGLQHPVQRRGQCGAAGVQNRGMV